MEIRGEREKALKEIIANKTKIKHGTKCKSLLEEFQCQSRNEKKEKYCKTEDYGIVSGLLGFELEIKA